MGLTLMLDCDAMDTACRLMPTVLHRHAYIHVVISRPNTIVQDTCSNEHSLCDASLRSRPIIIKFV